MAASTSLAFVAIPAAADSDVLAWVMFAALLAAPAVIGETLLRSGHRPLGIGLGGAVALIAVLFFFGLSLLVCGLVDNPEPGFARTCDRQIGAAREIALAAGAVVLALMVVVLRRPDSKALRYALWATPAGMFAMTGVVHLVFD